jgi:hypothetical protein
LDFVINLRIDSSMRFLFVKLGLHPYQGRVSPPVLRR